VIVSVAAVLAAHGEILVGQVFVFADPFVHPPWTALAPAGGSGLPRMMADWIRYTHPAWELAHQELSEGRLPLWDPYVFCGHDHAGSVQPAVFSPIRSAFGLLPPATGLSLYVLFHACLGAAGAALFLRGRRSSISAAVTGAVVLTLSGYLLAKLGQPTTLATSAWLPWLLWGADRWRQRGSWRATGLLALLVAACFLSGHVQVFVLVVMTVGLFVLGSVLRDRTDCIPIRRRFVQGLVVTVLGFGMVSPQLVAFWRSAPATRGPGAEVAPPLKRPAPDLAWSLLVPEPFGSPPDSTFDRYRLEEQLEVSAGERATWHAGGLLYPGALALVVLPLCLAHLRRHAYVPEAGVLLLAYPVVFVPWLHEAVRASVPGLGVSPLDRLLLVGHFGWALIAAAGVDLLRRAPRRQAAALIAAGAGAAGAAVAAFHLLHGSWPASANAWVHPVVAIAAASAVGVVASVARGRKALAGALLAALALVELAPLSHGYGPTSNLDQILPPSRTTRFLQDRVGYDRIARYRTRALRPNLAVMLGLRDVQGFAPLFSERYRRAWSLVRPDESGGDVRWLRPLRSRSALGSPLLRMLGARFLLAESLLDHPDWKPVLRSEGLVVHESVRKPLRVRVVGRGIPAGTDRQALDRLVEPSFEPNRETVLVGGRIERWDVAMPGRTGSARILAETPRKVELAVEAKRDSLLVLADTFHPDWRATVDGRETAILRADVAFRAVPVPKGRSEVVFRHRPRWLAPSLIAGGVASLIALCLACWPRGLNRGRGRDERAAVGSR
jgi:hypothetical protein